MSWLSLLTRGGPGLNPVAAMACTADAVSSDSGQAIKADVLVRWLMGTLYPLSGNQNGGKG